MEWKLAAAAARRRRCRSWPLLVASGCSLSIQSEAPAHCWGPQTLLGGRSEAGWQVELLQL